MAVIRSWEKQGHLYSALKMYNEKCKDEKLNIKISEFLNLIELFKLYAMTYNISELISRVYNETCVYNAMLLEDDGKQRQMNFEALLQIAQTFDNSKNATIYTFIQYVENIRKKSDTSDGPRLIGENENVVRIMTIHHSKGLEFPVVILMNSNRTFRFPETSERILLDSNLGIGLSIYDKNLNITYPSIVNMAIKSNIKYLQKSEALRVLYVALTRAKEKIIIYGTVKNADKLLEDISIGIEEGQVSQTILQQNNSQLKNILCGAIANSNKNNFVINVIDHEENQKSDIEHNKSKIEVLLNRVKEYDIKPDEEYIEQTYNKLQYCYPYEQSKGILQKYTATEINKMSEDKEEFIEDNLTELAPKVLTTKVTNKSFGTCVHKIIENIDMLNAIIEDIVEESEKVLSEFEVGNIDKKYIARKIMTMIFILKQNKLLNDNSKIEKEYEFVIKDNMKGIIEQSLSESSLIQGIIDMYIETDGKSYIIDFKTDRVYDENELKKRYKTQLAIYKRGITLSLNKPNVQVYIYSFALDKLIRLDN